VVDLATPIVTVITPTFNRVGFLPETIESVLAQDYPRIDHLVLDDGSTDDTPDLLTTLVGLRPDRLRWVRHDNIGQAATINRGFELADGDFCLILNSDDVLSPSCISRLVESVASVAGSVGAYPDSYIIDEAGAIVGELHLPEFSLEQMVRTQNNFLGPGVLFNTSIARRLGGWDTSYRIMPDLEFWLRLCLDGPFVHVPETLASWRNHPGSITMVDKGRAALDERLRILDTWFTRVDLPTELRETEGDAYRNAFHIAAIETLPGVNRPEDRFVLHDRLGWQIDAHAAGSSVEAQLLEEREHAQRLSDLVEHYRSEIARLIHDVEVRDGWMRDVRAKELEPERAHSGRLQVQVDRLLAENDSLSRQLAALRTPGHPGQH
jgi:glycosyltransferase involved in cell wall biosynthesis